MNRWESKIWGGLLAVMAAILFSTKAIFVKLAYQYEVDAVGLLMLRMTFSLPFFLVVGWLEIRKTVNPFQGRPKLFWKVAAMGVMGYYMASFLDLLGLQFIDASLERVILYSYPTVVVLLNYFIFKEKITSLQLLAIGLAYAGIFISFWGNIHLEQESDILHGGVLILMSAIAFAIYIVGTGKLSPSLGSKTYNSIAMIMASVAILIHNGILHGFNVLDFEKEVYILALCISILSTVLPSYIMVEGIRIIGANNGSIIGSIGPISTIILAVIFLEEHINLQQGIGSIVVILSVLLLLLGKRIRRAEKV